MDEKDAVGTAEAEGAGSLRRLLPRAALLAFISTLVALGASGFPAAAGAAGGALLCGFYASTFIRSHLSNRTRTINRSVAGAAMIRLAAVGVGGGGAWLAGRGVLIAYLATFALGLPVLIATEAPRVTRELRARGLVGGGGAR